MITRLLIGFDASPCSLYALQSLRRAGLPGAGEAVVLTCADVATHHFAWIRPHRMADLIREESALRAAADTASRGLALLQQFLPGWDLSTEVSANPPAQELLNRAAAWHVDLLVVGSHGRQGLQKLFLGSVAEQVLKHAPCSVRVCHGESPAPTATGPLHILVGVDGSEGSAAAVRAAGGRAWPPDTQFRILSVVDTRMLIFAGEFPIIDIPPLTESECQTTAERHAALAAAARLRQAGLNATAKVAAGDPVQVLLSEAAEWNADAIFIGAAGLPRLEQILLGKIAAPLAAQSACPVEIVRTPIPAVRPVKNSIII